jgi:hypothetical protein
MKPSSLALLAFVLAASVSSQAQPLLVHVDGQYYDVTTFSGYARTSQGIFDQQPIWNNPQLAADIALAVGDQLGDPNGNFPISPAYVYGLIAVDPSFEDPNAAYITVPSGDPDGYLQMADIQPDSLWEFADVTYASVPDAGSSAVNAFLITPFAFLCLRHLRPNKRVAA